jgi:hypothetical protein
MNFSKKDILDRNDQSVLMRVFERLSRKAVLEAGLDGLMQPVSRPNHIDDERRVLRRESAPHDRQSELFETGEEPRNGCLPSGALQEQTSCPGFLNHLSIPSRHKARIEQASCRV